MILNSVFNNLIERFKSTMQHSIIKYAICFCLGVINTQSVANTIAAELLGVPLLNKITIANTNKPLVLNGYAVHSNAGQELYVGALYVSKIEKKARMLLLNDYSMAMAFYFVQDDVSAQILHQVFIEGILVNNASSLSKQFDLTRLSELRQQLGLLSLEAGDILLFTYSADNENLSMLLNNRVLYQWPHAKTFYNILLKMWIGAHPPSREFKRAILNFPTE